MVRSFLFGLSLIAAASVAHAQSPPAPNGPPLPQGLFDRIGDWRLLRTGQIDAIAISPDGKLVAAAGGGISIQDAATGKFLRSIRAETVSIMTFSTDGRLLATGKNRSEIELWDVSTGKAVWSTEEKPRKTLYRMPNLHQKGVRFPRGITALRFIDNDKSLAVESDYPSIELWDVLKGTATQTYAERLWLSLPKGYKVASASLSPSGKHMAWLLNPDGKGAERPKDPAVVVFDTLNGWKRSEVSVKFPERVPSSLKMLDEGRTVLVESEVIGATDGKMRFRFPFEPVIHPIGEKSAHFDDFFHLENFLAINPDRKSFFVLDGDRFKQWEVATGKKLFEGSAVSALTFSKDGKRSVRAVDRGLEIFDVKSDPTGGKQQP
jgi:WD40 repeat protein